MNITLFAEGFDSIHDGKLLGETFGFAVLDSSSTSNIHSDCCLHCYIETLDVKGIYLLKE